MKGQVVISKEIREQLGIEPGWEALGRVVGDEVVLRFVPPEHRRSLRDVSTPTLAGWHSALGEEIAWNAAANEKPWKR
jgi:bifunctional DNA-binding transcriptional regulator/antitoxin component of YhaV-PrlF toxin-antitoxin module